MFLVRQGKAGGLIRIQAAVDAQTHRLMGFNPAAGGGFHKFTGGFLAALISVLPSSESMASRA